MVTPQNPKKMQKGGMYFLLVSGLLLGFMMGVLITMETSMNTVVFESLEDVRYDSYNLGWDECKSNWLNKELGKNDSSACFYELNEDKIKERFVCGEFATLWEDIK